MTKFDSFQESNVALMFEKEIKKNNIKISIQEKKFTKNATFMDKSHRHILSKGSQIQKNISSMIIFILSSKAGKTKLYYLEMLTWQQNYKAMK